LAQLLLNHKFFKKQSVEQGANQQETFADKHVLYHFNENRNLIALDEIPTEYCGACKKFTEIIYFDVPITLACGHKFHSECLAESRENSMGQCSSCYESVYYTATHSDTDLILPFISKMLRSNIYTVKKDITQFVEKFNTSYGPNRSKSKSKSKSPPNVILKSARDELNDFLNQTNASILSNMQLLEMQEEGRSKCMTTVKQNVLPAVYHTLFKLYTNNSKDKDVLFIKKLKSLSSATLQQLQISPKFELDSPAYSPNHLNKSGHSPDNSPQNSYSNYETIDQKLWGYYDAIQEFQKLPQCLSVTDKVNCLILTRHYIHYSILKFWKAKGEKLTEDLMLDADQLVLIWSFLIINSNLSSLYSEIDYINDWIDQHLVNGESGFCLVTLQTAVGYLEKIDATRFGNIT